jgi:hypothetical protein
VQQEQDVCLKYGPIKVSYKKWLPYPMDGYVEVEETKYGCIEYQEGE